MIYFPTYFEIHDKMYRFMHKYVCVLKEEKTLKE